MNIMETSDIIAILALLVSVVSMGWTWSTRNKLSKQQLALNEQQDLINMQQLILNEQILVKNKEEEESKKKANVQAKAVRKPKMWAVSIRNTGHATAKNVRLSSSDIECEESGIVLLTESGLLPYPLLHPNEEFEICAMLNSEHNPTPRITLTWDDDYSNANEKEQVIQF